MRVNRPSQIATTGTAKSPIGRDLDVPVIRQAAMADPAGFVDYPDIMVIDEIQRVPELLLPIKVQVDNDGRRGRPISSAPCR